MRLCRQFIGALTLAIASIACATSASGADGAADHSQHHMPAWFATADQLLAELAPISQLHAAR